MTAPSPVRIQNETVAGLYKRHIREMLRYADQLANVLGSDSPVVHRIRSCAVSNDNAMDAIIKREAEKAKEPTAPPTKPFCSCCGNKTNG